MLSVADLARAAKTAARALGLASTTQRNCALLAMADALDNNATPILDANRRDLEAARVHGMSDALVDRLSLAGGRLERIAGDMRAVAELPDPLGSVIEERTLPNGIQLSRLRVPLGVVGVIYEARPNVTADIAALTVKTGNSALLRGGSETRNTNRAMVGVLRDALEESGLPGAALQFIDDPDRARITEMLRLDSWIDMIIPRGGAALQRTCVENSTVPVIVGGIGICHLFADSSCDFERALDVIENAKCSRPSVCNSLDTLLVHEDIASEFLPKVHQRLGARGVEFRADSRALDVLAGLPRVVLAGPDDFDTEWMALVLGIKVVDSLDDAIAHIAAHGDHSDGILTENPAHAVRFVQEIDSAAVFVNASTRFNDGGQFGLGAEVAVSTRKLHARGPMGLESLTSYKWVARGDYHCRG